MNAVSEKPQQPKENPKQKYFIIGFSVVVLVALAASIFLKDDFDKTQRHFLKVWKAHDQKKILSMASKQIFIGQFDSENSVTEDAVKALPYLLQITEKSAWSDGFRETESGDSRLRIIVSEGDSGEGTYQLLFSKLDSGKWMWSGFLMMHLEDFASLLNGAAPVDPKFQYKEIQTDPADGSEQTLTD